MPIGHAARTGRLAAFRRHIRSRAAAGPAMTAVCRPAALSRSFAPVRPATAPSRPGQICHAHTRLSLRVPAHVFGHAPQRRVSSSATSSSTSSSSGGGTAIVLLNMGGPATAAVADVRAFLQALFSDRELVGLPGQRWSGPALAAARAPRVARLYESIGGGSPIGHWTRAQAAAVERALNEDPTLADGRPYQGLVAFRYTQPDARAALETLAASGARRAVAFSLYPQYSCATTGSSLNALWAAVMAAGPRLSHVRWSVLDRWGEEPALLDVLADHVAVALADAPAAERARVPVLFSAHSLPRASVVRGDPYVWEVAATAAGTMRQLAQRHGLRPPHLLAWQSAVGPASRWQGPQTIDVLRGLRAVSGSKHVVVVPVAFTQDHIETLREIDIDFRAEAEKHGLTLLRAASLNCSPGGVRALSLAVRGHLLAHTNASPSYALRCVNCVRPHLCRRVLHPAYPLSEGESSSSVQGTAPPA